MAAPDTSYTTIGVSTVQGEKCLVMTKVDETGTLLSEITIVPNIKTTARDEYLTILRAVINEVIQ